MSRALGPSIWNREDLAMSYDPRWLLEQCMDDVQHPNVSTFQLLVLVQTRSVLARLEAQLSTDER
jgi:hypothetical protein